MLTLLALLIAARAGYGDRFVREALGRNPEILMETADKLRDKQVAPAIEAQREYRVLGGEVPSPLNPPRGCVFHTRCPLASAECKVAVPELREIRPRHYAACIKV